MKANTKNMKPTVEEVKVEEFKIEEVEIDPKSRYLQDLKIKNERLALIDADIKELEARILELKKMKIDLGCKSFNYKTPKNEGVGNMIRDLILQGLGNKDILSIVQEHYGNNNTTYSCVAWYRNDMKKLGIIS